MSKVCAGGIVEAAELPLVFVVVLMGCFDEDVIFGA